MNPAELFSNMSSSCSVTVNGGTYTLFLTNQRKKSMDLRCSDLGCPFIEHNCHLHSTCTRKGSVV